MPETKKPTAIITGSSRGIGAGVAERLSKDGFNIVINYVQSAKPAEDLVKRIISSGAQAVAIKADVSDAGSFAAMFDDAEEAFGGVDVLINNAGIMKLATVAETGDDLFDSHIAINLKGVFNGLRLASTRLREGGAIVNFSSSVVGLYQPTYSVYAATKAAVEAMTKILSKELGNRQITVNAVAPGPTATDLFLKDKPQESISHIASLAPLGRLGEVEDIANTVSFLVGPDGRWINGQVLRSNGGMI